MRAEVFVILKSITELISQIAAAQDLGVGEVNTRRDDRHADDLAILRPEDPVRIGAGNVVSVVDVAIGSGEEYMHPAGRCRRVVRIELVSCQRQTFGEQIRQGALEELVPGAAMPGCGRRVRCGQFIPPIGG